MMDQRAKRYFKSEETFDEAMVLFQKFVKAQNACSSLDELQETFFDQLDDITGDDSRLLEQAANYYQSKQLDHGVPHAAQVAELARLLSSHLSLQPAIPALTPPASSQRRTPLHVACEDFISHRKHAWKSASGMESGYRDVYFPLFVEVVGDISTEELTKSHVNEFIKIVQNLPSNRTKHARYKSLEIRDFLTRDVPETDRLSPTSVRKYVSQISSFLTWLKANDLTALDLDSPAKGVKVKRLRAVDQRAAFTPDDLKKLFNSEQYRRGLHRTAAQFWVPLIGLFTGARLNEICQLATGDVRTEESTDRWVFDFNNDTSKDGFKSLKADHHARLVPIHKVLLDLGFIAFVRRQRDAKHERLFPELPYVAGANKYGDRLQRWFNRTYTQNCGVSTPKTSFHSLRHTVISHLANDHRIDTNLFAVGMGQTPIGGITQTRYTKRTTFENYAPHFDLINLQKFFDVKKIRRWDKHLY